MPMAIAYDAAKTNAVRIEGDGSGITGNLSLTQFLGGRDKPDLPYAALVQIDPGTVSATHFHIADQFQVVVDGKGKIGRHDLAPYGVHFTRAYTPYGPLVADAGTGLTFFVMRAHPDPGSQRLPEKKDQLKLMSDRQPWQITRQAVFPAPRSGTAGTVDTLLQVVPGIKDANGLAAYTLNVKPNAKACAPDPAHGDGQYLVVVKGSLLHDGNEYKALALVFVRPDEGPFQIHAGPEGLEALVLNMPRPQTRATGASKGAQAMTDFRTWQCMLCAFVYDEAAGLPEEGIPPGTRWQDVPETWNCPDCSVSKADFQMVELQS